MLRIRIEYFLIVLIAFSLSHIVIVYISTHSVSSGCPTPRHLTATGRGKLRKVTSEDFHCTAQFVQTVWLRGVIQADTQLRTAGT
jgi:hypothetical protein